MRYDDYVVKHMTNNPLVSEQGRWLLDHPSPAVPRVYAVYVNSHYTMERLAEPPIALLDHERVARVMIDTLVTHIWSQPGAVPINHDMLQEKLERLSSSYHGFSSLWTWIVKTHAQVRWSDVPRCLTHGDPTFDNVMIREETGELVFVDPLPASLVAPDMRCVDIGKILQSVLGWERIRYGSERFSLRASVTDLAGVLRTTLRVSENEWRASVFWCVVHLLRTLPYVTDDVRVGVRELVNRAVALS